MKNYTANSENFDKQFKTLLKSKKKKYAIKSQFDFENAIIEKKIKLIA